jgi:anti-sigma-K factor RskA
VSTWDNGSWDSEDRAIARALDQDAVPSGPVDEEALDDYHAALAHLPVDEVAPPAELEDRVMAAALERRPAAAVSIDRHATEPRTRRRRLTLAAVAVAAAVVIVALLAGRHTTAPPKGRIQTVAVAHADIERALARPGSRTGTLRGVLTSPISVVLERDGTGYLYHLGPSSPASTLRTEWLWLDTADGPVRVGAIPPSARDALMFHVSGDVDQVRGVFVTFEPPGVTPSNPGSSVAARTELSSR